MISNTNKNFLVLSIDCLFFCCQEQNKERKTKREKTAAGTREKKPRTVFNISGCRTPWLCQSPVSHFISESIKTKQYKKRKHYVNDRIAHNSHCLYHYLALLCNHLCDQIGKMEEIRVKAAAAALKSKLCSGACPDVRDSTSICTEVSGFLPRPCPVSTHPEWVSSAAVVRSSGKQLQFTAQCQCRSSGTRLLTSGTNVILHMDCNVSLRAYVDRLL